MHSTPPLLRLLPSARPLAVLLCLLLISGLLAACTEPEPELPEATYAEFVKRTEALDGISAVRQVGPVTNYVVTLDVNPDSDASALEDTAEKLLAAVNDHRYPQGPPDVTVEAGVFTGRVGHAVHGASPGVPQPGPLNLGQLPFLLSLPDVTSGEIGENTNASVELPHETDLREWITAAAAEERKLRLSVSRLARGDEIHLVEHGHARPHHGPDPEPRVSATVDMSMPGAQSAVTRFYDTAEKSGSLPSEVTWQTSPEQLDAILLVEKDADIAGVRDAFAAEYGAGALSKVTVASAEGLRMELGDGRQDAAGYFRARDLLADRGITVERIALSRRSLTVTAPSSTELRALAELVSGSDWLLPGEVRISAHNTEHTDDDATFSAAEWPAHADLLAALWDAGFTSVSMSGAVGGTGADFRLEIRPADGQDLTSAESQEALIRVLRDTGWDGTALISLATGGHPVFTATERGRAKGAYMSLHGVDRTPSGWAKRFLDSFNATAG